MPSHASHAAANLPFAPESRFYQGPFGRMFRNLPAWSPPGASEAAKINAIEKLAADHFVPVAPGAAPTNPKIPAAYTYLGQFIDHDITFDPTSSLQRANDPDHLHNFRTPRFDLDNIYGRGPDDQPYLYQQSNRDRMLLGVNPNGEPDLPRSADASGDSANPFNVRHTALIGDPRNDENIIVSQVQLAFLEFHNARIDEGLDFEAARRSTRWHYQWVVIHDFLKRLCGTTLVNQLLTSDTPGQPTLKYYHYEDQPYMPVEFAGAAYRLGHSMIRGRYKLSDHLHSINGGNLLEIFRLPEPDDAHLRLSLVGRRALPPFWTIQWDLFLGGSAAVQQSLKIDTNLVSPLATLPDFAASPKREQSLAFRNLLRGWRLGLPSGQAVARRMGLKPIPPINSLGVEDPLWAYILNEAEVQKQGERLGKVGARIVGEVFVGLLAADPFSFYSVDPNWTPEIAGAGGPGTFDFADFLRSAGAPMTDAEAKARMGV